MDSRTIIELSQEEYDAFFEEMGLCAKFRPGVKLDNLEADLLLHGPAVGCGRIWFGAYAEYVSGGSVVQLRGLADRYRIASSQIPLRGCCAHGTQGMTSVIMTNIANRNRCPWPSGSENLIFFSSSSPLYSVQVSFSLDRKTGSDRKLEKLARDDFPDFFIPERGFTFVNMFACDSCSDQIAQTALSVFFHEVISGRGQSLFTSPEAKRIGYVLDPSRIRSSVRTLAAYE